MRWLYLCLFFFALTVYANDDIEKYKNSWVGKTLKLQREIDLNTPLNQATILGTHNSENAKVYTIPFIRYVDPNQIFSIYDQLDIGVRSIELDIHWTLGNHFEKEILLCHGLNNHLGCSAFDRPVEDGLIELRDWLKNNPNEVVLLYLDRTLDGHEPRLAALFDNLLGQFIFKPTLVRKPNRVGHSCMSIPSETLTKADILKAGKQLLIVTKKCDGENPPYEEQDQFKLNWNDFVFSGIGNMWVDHFNFLDSTIDERYTPFPDCSKTIFAKDPGHTSMWRLYDDLTTLSNIETPAHKISPEEMRDMMRCNINWPTMDMLDINDERVAATIWSWAIDFPKNDLGQCAIYKKNEGIENISCDKTVASYACFNSTSNEWKTILASGNIVNGETQCQTIAGSDWHFRMPVNGKQMESLKNSLLNSGLSEVAVNYRVNKEGNWQANT